MSETEQAVQTVAIITEYRNSKVAFNRLMLKIEGVFIAYRAAGAAVDFGSVNPGPELADGQLQLGRQFSDRHFLAELLNAADLTALIVERDAARKRVETARKVMDDIGLGAIG